MSVLRRARQRHLQQAEWIRDREWDKAAAILAEYIRRQMDDDVAGLGYWDVDVMGIRWTCPVPRSFYGGHVHTSIVPEMRHILMKDDIDWNTLTCTDHINGIQNIVVTFPRTSRPTDKQRQKREHVTPSESERRLFDLHD